jgi:chromosomal replication initiation ATPase DnaA
VHRYTQFIREGLSWGHREDLYAVLDQRFLGTEQFAASIERCAGIGEAREPVRTPRLSLAQCLDLVSRRLGLEPSAIQSNARLHALARARRLFSFLACRHAGHPVSAAARFLGVDPSGVTNALHWCEQNLSASLDFAGDAEAIIRRGRGSSRQFHNV